MGFNSPGLRHALNVALGVKNMPKVVSHNVASDNPTKAVTNRSAASRWTEPLVKDGFTPVSNFFLKYACELRPVITHGEMMLIIQLMLHKWDENMPYPAYKTLAKRMGISHGQARKLARALQRKGYLRRRIRENLPNKFDVGPLLAELTELRAVKKVEQAKQRKEYTRRLL